MVRLYTSPLVVFYYFILYLAHLLYSLGQILIDYIVLVAIALAALVVLGVLYTLPGAHQTVR